MKLTKSCAKFLRKHGGTILAIAASVGVGLTAYETGKATVKATTLVNMNKAEPMTKKEVVQDCWKFYIPAAVVGVGTVACILGSNALNKKQLAKMTAAYLAVGKTYEEYRKQVAEQLGREQEEALHKAALEKKEPEYDRNGEPVRLFYDPISERYFHATMTRASDAAYYFNRKLAEDGFVSVNDYYGYLGADELGFEAKWDELGWCIDQLIYDWDLYWMDFDYSKETTDDGLECYCYTPMLEPIGYYLNYEEEKYREEQKERIRIS